jgi:hypothetical protein
MTIKNIEICLARFPVSKGACKWWVNQNIWYVKLKHIDQHITENDTKSYWIASPSLMFKIQYEKIKYFKNYINTYKIILIYILTISPSSAN